MHLLFDTISSLAVVAVGVVLLFRPWYRLDLLVSLAIVLMMVWSSVSIISEAVRFGIEHSAIQVETSPICSGDSNGNCCR